MSAPEIIASTEYIGNSLTKINNNTTNLFNRVNTLESTSSTQNTTINNLNTQILGSGSLVQRISNQVNLGNISNSTHGGTVADTGFPPLSITRRGGTQPARLLIDLSGGFWNLDTNRFLETWIYGQLNGTGPIQDIIGFPVEYITRASSGRHKGSHSGRALYTLQPGTTTISIYIYARVSSANTNYWNDVSTGSPVVPFCVTVSQIMV